MLSFRTHPAMAPPEPLQLLTKPSVFGFQLHQSNHKLRVLIPQAVKLCGVRGVQGGNQKQSRRHLADTQQIPQSSDSLLRDNAVSDDAELFVAGQAEGGVGAPPGGPPLHPFGERRV